MKNEASENTEHETQTGSRTFNFMKLWRDIHAYLAMFFLPVALLFAITGFLYICGATGNLNTKKHDVTLSVPIPKPFAQNIEAQKQVMIEFAKANGIPIPAGEASKGRTGVILGKSTGYHFVLIPDQTKDTAVLQVNDPGLHYKMVMLHKAKCGLGFKVLGVGFGIAMVILYISGIYLLWKNKSLRRKLLISGLIGLVVTILLGVLSL